MMANLYSSLVILLLLSKLAITQNSLSLQLSECYELSSKNFPLIKQHALIDKAKEYTLDNASKGFLPQINLSGQATYQSDVTRIPLSIPNFPINELSKDQYRIYGELNQSLTDPLIIKQQKDIIRASSSAEQEKISVEIYKLRERINQIYFGILLIDAQIKHIGFIQNDLELNAKKAAVALKNGVIQKSNLEVLQVENLKIGQRKIELLASRKGFLNMLSLLIGKELADTIELKTPALLATSSSIVRPEIKLFEIQKQNIQLQNKLLMAKNLPRLSLFLQAGYGRPALNMLSNEFDTYYIGGARFSWNLSGFYSFNKDKKLIQIQSDLIDVQKEIFLFNSHLILKQQQSEIDKLSELIQTDLNIISLRESIRKSAQTQLEQGTITTTEYLNTLNSEDQAKQNNIIHYTQLLLAQYNYQTTSGN